MIFRGLPRLSSRQTEDEIEICQKAAEAPTLPAESFNPPVQQDDDVVSDDSLAEALAENEEFPPLPEEAILRQEPTPARVPIIIISNSYENNENYTTKM